MKFTYLVTVEVEDDLGMATECYDPDYFDRCETDYEEGREGEEDFVTGRWLYPDTKAAIIMSNRLDVDEDLGSGIGNYTIEYRKVGR